ncbi:hypothetical protein CEP52_006156 [Fusarium oligoseptatum]|uniref:Uncharacterized protein n=1 Tax=Fusarium oligoseptatum TaxID=2604345 RepID=A0A428TUG1_9HYPO|nr:hypothetical protein CEP52_006156 [Fusarium oligoseptatum]
MPSNYEKLSRPSGPSIDTLALPEKAAFSTNTTVCPDDTPRMSTTSTPRSDRSTNPFDTDIEAMVPTHTTDSSVPSLGRATARSGPERTTGSKKAKANKAKNRCTCMANLSRRNRIIVKVLMVFLVVGVAVGVGFGVSKPLNAPIWGDRDNKH